MLLFRNGHVLIHAMEMSIDLGTSYVCMYIIYMHIYVYIRTHIYVYICVFICIPMISEDITMVCRTDIYSVTII